MRISVLMCVVLLGSFLAGTAGSQDAKPNVKPDIRRIAGNVYMVDESGPASSEVRLSDGEVVRAEIHW